jgi:hypothetical protein
MSNAWETTTDDVEIVLRRLDISKMPDEIEAILDQLDTAAIEKVALCGDTMDDQTSFAHNEIERQLQELGLLRRRHVEKELLETISTLRSSCKDAISGKWEVNDEGLEAMSEACGRAIRLVKKLAKAPTIIVEVEGGCVRAVYSDQPGVKVQLLDWDNVKGGDATAAERRTAKALASKARRMHDVF